MMTLQGALVLSRALHFCACAVVLGGAGLLWLLQSSPETDAGIDRDRRLIRTAAVIAALSGAAWLATTLVIITADPGSLFDPDVWSTFWRSSFGLPWAIRLGLLAAAFGIAVAGRATTLRLLALCGAALAIDQAWLGHAATGSGPSGDVMIASDALHVTAAYAWTGALPILGLLVVREPRSARTAQALTLFSTIGVLAVATILATGVMNASFRLDTSAQMVGTAYGRILSLKITVFASMLALAWINRTVTAPGQSTTFDSGRRALLIGVLVEAGLGLLVLSLAALLGTTAPPI